MGEDWFSISFGDGVEDALWDALEAIGKGWNLRLHLRDPFEPFIDFRFDRVLVGEHGFTIAGRFVTDLGEETERVSETEDFIWVGDIRNIHIY